MSGKKYGKWLVLWHCGGSFWMCRCECGLRKRVDGRTIRNGISTGCHSCHNKTANLKHGMCCSSEYVIWSGIVQRCTDKRHHAYKCYGGRGIVVCPRWSLS